jgi:hypothetical protein
MKPQSVPLLRTLAVVCLLAAWPRPAAAYIKYPPTTLGDLCRQSNHIYVLRVEKVSAERGMILFTPVRQLKALEPLPDGALARHVIAPDANGGKVILDRAAEGKTAIMFAKMQDVKAHVYIDGYWYSVLYEAKANCWVSANGEPLLLTRYCGTVDQLGDAVTKILRGEEVVVPAMVGDNKQDLEQRRARVQDLRASLRILGAAEVRKPDHVGTVQALAADGKSFRLLPLPTEKNKEPASLDIRVSERTRITAGPEGQEAGKLAVGQTVSVVLAGKSANDAAEVRTGQPPDKPEKEPAPEEKGKKPGDNKPEDKKPAEKKPEPGEKKPVVRTPDRVGTVKGLAADGKSFTLQPAPTEKNKEPAPIEIRISEGAKILAGNEPGKLAVGQTVNLWFAKGSENVAVEVRIGTLPEPPEKQPAPPPPDKGKAPPPDAKEKKPEEPAGLKGPAAPG